MTSQSQPPDRAVILMVETSAIVPKETTNRY
jgi:hypothetical protein